MTSPTPEADKRPAVPASRKHPVLLFYAYSHKDERFRRELNKHLSLLQRQRLLAGWSDWCIDAGRELDREIEEKLEQAQIVLLLVSADFLASDYCYCKEMRRALERHERAEATVIPVILRSVAWEGAPFSGLKALPHDGKPITKWRPQDEGFKNVAEGVREVVLKLCSKSGL